MSPEAVLAQLQALGVQVQLTADSQHPLYLAPADRIPVGLREEIVTHKSDIAAVVRADAVGWRVAAMRTQLPEFPRPAPLLVARPERQYQPGHCISCGDLVPVSRCAPCREAVAVVLAEWQDQSSRLPGAESDRQPTEGNR
ncbi:MAG: hypothetical protein ACYCS9_08175 [Candidatus Dormibacteria bacterium]